MGHTKIKSIAMVLLIISALIIVLGTCTEAPPEAPVKPLAIAQDTACMVAVNHYISKTQGIMTPSVEKLMRDITSWYHAKLPEGSYSNEDLAIDTMIFNSEVKSGKISRSEIKYLLLECFQTYTES